MHFLILGANGRTGQLVTASALKNGHAVTALVRNTSSMTPQPGLNIVQGTPLQQTDIEAAFASAPKDNPINAVISTLNAARKSDSPFAEPVAPPMFVHDSVLNAIAVMQAHGVKRLVIMSAFGVGSSYTQLPFPMKALFRHSNMKFQIEDHDSLDVEVREKQRLEWLLVRPARLMEGEAVEVREMGEEGEGVGWLGSVSRASVAEFLVLAAEGRKGWGRAVVVAA